MSKIYYVYEWINNESYIGGIFDTEYKAWKSCVNDNMLYVEMELNKPLTVGKIEEQADVHPFSKQRFNVEKGFWEHYDLLLGE